MQKCWIVVRDTLEMRATFRHLTEESARKEAERLTRTHGERFLVFGLVGLCEVARPPVAWVEPVGVEVEHNNESPDVESPF